MKILLSFLFLTHSFFLYSASVNPIQNQKKAYSYSNGAEQILRSVNHTILPNSPYESDEFSTPPFIEMLNQKANEIRNYISTEYEEDFSLFSNQEMILIGLGLVSFEQRDNNNLMDPGQAFSCFMQAVGIASGVAGLVAEFSSAWTSGISAKSMLRIIGRMAGTYISWFMVGWAVKEFGECVGWW